MATRARCERPRRHLGLDVLAGDEGQSSAAALVAAFERVVAASSAECGVGVVDQSVDEGLSGGSGRPSHTAACPAWRSRRRGGATARTSAASGLAAWSRAHESLRITARSWVTVSSVATASKIGVESRTRARCSQRPGRLGDDLGVFEQPSGTLRGPEAVARADEHRRVEGLCADRHARRCLPAQIEAEPIAGLTIREPFEGLEDHHRGQNPGRHRRSTVRRVE